MFDEQPKANDNSVKGKKRHNIHCKSKLETIKSSLTQDTGTFSSVIILHLGCERRKLGVGGKFWNQV